MKSISLAILFSLLASVAIAQDDHNTTVQAESAVATEAVTDQPAPQAPVDHATAPVGEGQAPTEHTGTPADHATEGEHAAAAEGHGGGHGGGGEHHAEGIPMDVLFQTINFLLFAGLVIYFLRKPVKDYFADRSVNFRQALFKAEAARAEAERQKSEIETRLRALEGGANNSLAQAKADAAELRHKIVREAEELAAKLREDAKRTAEIELQRAKAELREEVLNQAVTAAKAVLSERIAETDQKRLQSEFVEKIQAGR